MRPATRFGSNTSSASVFLAQTHEADGLARDGAHGQGRAAAPVAIHPGQDHARHADLAVEFGGHVDGVLAGQTIDHQQRFAWGDGVAHGQHFVHQHIVNMQAARGIQQIHVIAAQSGLLLGALGNIKPPTGL